MDAEIGIYETNNQPKKSTFKYEQEGWFCLGVAKVENKEYGTITGKLCLVFDYTGKKNVTIYALKKNPKLIRKNKEAYFVVITMVRKN